MTSKLRLKLGRIEVEFEGTEEFIKQDLLPLLQKAKDLVGAIEDSPPDDETQQKKTPTNFKDLTTSMISAQLGVDSGPELIVAALAKRCIVDKAAKVSRKELTAEMRTASTYFKDTYVGNLTKSLNSLIDAKRVNDLGSDNYSLHASEQAAVEKKLAEAK